MKNKFTTYTFTQRLGLEGIGDMEHEWLTIEEIEQSIAQDKIRVQKLKDEGVYGQEYTTTFIVEQDDIFDQKESKPTESYRMEIINFEDEK